MESVSKASSFLASVTIPVPGHIFHHMETTRLLPGKLSHTPSSEFDRFLWHNSELIAGHLIELHPIKSKRFLTFLKFVLLKELLNIIIAFLYMAFSKINNNKNIHIHRLILMG